MSAGIMIVSKNMFVDIDYFKSQVNSTVWECYIDDVSYIRDAISKRLSLKYKLEFPCFHEGTKYVRLFECDPNFLEKIDELTFGKEVRYFHVDFIAYPLLNSFIKQFANHRDFWIEIHPESSMLAVDYINKLKQNPDWDWRLTYDLHAL